MQFRLVYEGPLKATTQNDTRSTEKHEIRRQLHPQLKRLWEADPTLMEMRDRIEPLARDFVRCGYQFVPLVSQRYYLLAVLGILVLRRENPGSVLKNGGDIDNRLKTLFDGLRIPDSCSGFTRAADEDETMFVVLESDFLVSDLHVTTDRLLTPLRPNQDENDVVLIINVTLKASKSSLSNIDLV